MSRDYRNILQIASADDFNRLDQAYQASRERYLRLTAKGPLRYYRHELLEDARRAWQSLKNTPAGDRVEISPAGREAYRTSQTPKATARPVSLLARRVAAQRSGRVRKPSVKSPVKDPNARSRFTSVTPPVTEPRQSVRIAIPGARNKPIDTGFTSRYSKTELEDLFCKEVIYRLEGDMLRYSARQELLALASAWQIPLFQANLLMAQIVEAVRSNRLDRPGPREKQLAGGPAPTTSGSAATGAIVFCVLAFVLVDCLIVWVLSGR